MGDILSRLFSLIPVFLLIIWLLRMVAGARKRAQKRSANQKTSRNMNGTGGLASKRRRVSPRQIDEPAVMRKETFDSPSPFSPVEGRASKPFEMQAMTSSGALEQNQLFAEKEITRAETSRIRRKSLDSIRSYSPLARAMLGKIILEKPLALKEPER